MPTPASGLRLCVCWSQCAATVVCALCCSAWRRRTRTATSARRPVPYFRNCRKLIEEGKKEISTRGKMKNLAKIGLLIALAAAFCAAQQPSIQKDGGNWTSVVNGSLSGVHNLHIKVDIGAVRVEGGANQGISYVIRNKSYESAEDKARRQFDSYKISAYVRGDTAWIVGDWDGGRPRKFSSDVTVTVPREMELVKIETEGGAVVTTGISGRLETESGGGTIHLDDIGGAITEETGGGGHHV